MHRIVRSEWRCRKEKGIKRIDSKERRKKSNMKKEEKRTEKELENCLRKENDK